MDLYHDLARRGEGMMKSASPRIPIVPLGMSLGTFFAITYVLCVLYGLAITDRGMHELLPMLLPGFIWLTWPSFLVGLLWSFAYGWYVALLFAPLFNLFAARAGGENGA